MCASAACALVSWLVSLFTAHFQTESYEKVYACKDVAVQVGGGFVASVLVFGLSLLIFIAFLATIALSKGRLEAARGRLSNNAVTHNLTWLQRLAPTYAVDLGVQQSTDQPEAAGGMIVPAA